MSVRRGDVVLALYPLASGAGVSRRPALVVQADRDNLRMQNTIIAQITTNLRRAAEPTHLLIEAASPEGQAAGLLHDSVISCNNLATVHYARIDRVIGHLSDTTIQQLDACLKSALALQ